MVLSKELQAYVDDLPESMTLKKKIIKFIMKSNEPLTQKDIKEGLKQKGWTNVRRVLNELVSKGLIVKTRIGIKDYYVKIGIRKNSDSLEYHDEHNNHIIVYFDHFEPDTEKGEDILRIKQTRRIDLENYEVLGKLNVPFSQIDTIIEKLTHLKEEVHKNSGGKKSSLYEHKAN
jgi:Fe2+ or Zn2+ uptake regulation protein